MNVTVLSIVHVERVKYLGKFTLGNKLNISTLNYSKTNKSDQIVNRNKNAKIGNSDLD